MGFNRLQNSGTSAGRPHPVIGSYRLWRSGQAVVFGTYKKLIKSFLTHPIGFFGKRTPIGNSIFFNFG